MGWTGARVAQTVFTVLAAVLHAKACSIRLPAAAVPRARDGGGDLAARLVELRDIGSTPQPGKPVFSLSPDGQMIAFQLRQADPVENSFCFAMVVISAAGPAAPRIIDTGGELIRFTFPDLVGKANVPSGFPAIISPQWFNDGRSIAFLKRVNGRTQIWRAYIDGRSSELLSDGSDDIEEFKLLAGDRIIIATVRPSLRLALAEIAAEGRRGYHFDDRYLPIASGAPFPKPPLAISYVAIDAATGAERTATTAEIGEAWPKVGPAGQIDAISEKGSGSAWLEEVEGSGFPAKRRLTAQLPDGTIVPCTAPACSDVRDRPWWSGHGTIYFLRLEGWARSAMTIYEWDPRTPAPRAVFSTEDFIYGCQALAEDIVCLQEGSRAPRYLSRIDPEHSTATLLFDPNSDFRPDGRGGVRRLKLRTRFGTPFFADLTLPDDYIPGQRYPLILVQYNARGFLRGATGDEFPVQAFAQHGFAVLALERPDSPVHARNPKSFADLDKADFRGFRDRRNVLSAMETAVARLIGDGIVDSAKVGITGMSDGSTTVQYAALHSRMFAVAAMGSCCWERGYAGLLGPAIARQYRYIGWPAISSEAPDIWSKISWTTNARKIRMPVLLQLPDSEYRSALASYTALKEWGKPIDMFVYPEETHVKWQPAHKLALYERYLAWFCFWLKGEALQAPLLQTDIARWGEMKRGLYTATPHLDTSF